MLRRLIGENIELHTVLSEGLAPVNMDPGHLEQVLMNLAVNARDAMPGGGRLSIATSNVSMEARGRRRSVLVEPGQYVTITVIDSGCGMEAETRVRAFEPFFTTKEHGKGTGLGLSVVYGIVRQSGGDIRLNSAPGKGTTFTIYLPAAEIEDAGADEERDEGLVSDSPPRGYETVLVVEADAQIREFLVKFLARAGYRIMEAVDGVDAIDQFMECTEEVDILITDVVMPRMSGSELADRLRSRHAGIGVLLISGYPGTHLPDNGSQYPLLNKPFSGQDLLRKTREVLDLAKKRG